MYIVILKRIFCKAEIESQFSSATQSCLTLCDPMNLSTPGLVSNNSNNYNFSLKWMPDKTVTVVWDLRSFSLCDIGPHTSGYWIVLDSAYEKPVAPPIILKNQKCPHKISTILLWELHQVGEFSVVFCMSELLMNRDVESFQGHWCSKQLWNIQIGSVSEQRIGMLIAYYKSFRLPQPGVVFLSCKPLCVRRSLWPSPHCLRELRFREQGRKRRVFCLLLLLRVIRSCLWPQELMSSLSIH